MKDFFPLSIDLLRVSQLYLSKTKLNVVQSLNLSCESIYSPVLKKEGEYFLTDGHTRAYCLYLSGAKFINVYIDTDPLDYALYNKCIKWCEDAGVFNIPDLASRIVSHEEYLIKWISRCEQYSP